MRLPVLPADEARYPAEGWYWQPKDYSYPVYLGATFEAAAFRLRSQQLKDDDAGS